MRVIFIFTVALRTPYNLSLFDGAKGQIPKWIGPQRRPPTWWSSQSAAGWRQNFQKSFIKSGKCLQCHGRAALQLPLNQNCPRLSCLQHYARAGKFRVATVNRRACRLVKVLDHVEFSRAQWKHLKFRYLHWNPAYSESSRHDTWMDPTISTSIAWHSWESARLGRLRWSPGWWRPPPEPDAQLCWSFDFELRNRTSVPSSRPRRRRFLRLRGRTELWGPTRP